LDPDVSDRLQKAYVLDLAHDLPGVTLHACNSLEWARSGNAVLPALSALESARVAQLKTSAAQEQLWASLAGARMMLGQMLGVPPSDVDLQRDAEGAPWLGDHPYRRLSISRSDGWTAVALAERAPLGVDIERLRAIDWQPMLAMVCSDAERDAMRALAACAPDRGLAAFFELWTIKEAVLKTAGTGLRGGAKGVPVVVETLARPEGAHRRVAFAEAAFAVRTSWHNGLVASIAVAVSA
jgi:4'-phosphopantetheinyl transferase